MSQELQSTTSALPAGNTKKDMFSLQPQTLQEAREYAELLAGSDLVPKDFRGKPGNVLIAVQMGAEVGLPPTQAIQNIAVINGRPAMWGDAVLALAKASPICEYVVEEVYDDKAICKVKRRGEPETMRVFTMDDAKRAGLAGKQGPWREYPKRMLQMRARSWAIRDVFPDLLKGISIAEEVQDIAPIRDVTPSKPEGETRTEQLKNRLNGKQEEPPIEAEPAKQPSKEALAEIITLQAIIEDMQSATTEKELSDVANMAASLPEEDLPEARKMYKACLEKMQGDQNK